MDWREEKRREELAARKANDAAKEDPVFTQCVIAYCNWRRDGAQGSFDLFKKQWYAKRQKS
jgi:hypothetical protein